MEVNGKRLLVCDCNGTMPIDGKALARACAGGAAPSADLEIHTLLCRTQLARFEDALRAGRPVVVACTQEAPLFTEARAEAGLDTDMRFVNIREHAGWSDEADRAAPKMAALLAEAALDAPAPPTITLKSAGITLIYGRDEIAIDAARQIADRLDCTVLLTDPGDLAPPDLADVPIFKGTITSVRGHMGAFDIAVDDYAPVIPSSRGRLVFEAPRPGAFSSYDLILDLSGGQPLLAAPERRDGYVRADPRDRAAVQKALFDLVEMVGEFEKPVYVTYDAALCVHGRAGLRGCSACIEVCPPGAISSAGEQIEVDEFACAGCGGCAGVCPTGAMTYVVPPRQALLERLRTVLITYARAGGETPVLLIHDGASGEETIAALARRGRGLPAHVIPFHVNAVGQLDLEFFAVALAYGATRLCVSVDPAGRDEIDGLAVQADLANQILAGLGYGSGRVLIWTDGDAGALERLLRTTAPSPPRPALVPVAGGKRRVLWGALRHLHAVGPAAADRLPLPRGAPFGTVAVETAGCTLCAACTRICPTGALLSPPDRSRLNIVAEACVQCGLCVAACPEHVMTLKPGLDFTVAAKTPVLLKDSPPRPAAPAPRYAGDPTPRGM